MKLLYIGSTPNIGGAEKSILSSIINLPPQIKLNVKFLLPRTGTFSSMLKKNDIYYGTYFYHTFLPFTQTFLGIKFLNPFSILLNLTFFLSFIISVLIKIIRTKPDIIHINNFELNLTLPFFVKKFTNVKVVCHVREINIQNRKLFLLLKFIFSKYVDRILVVSEAVKEIFVSPRILFKVNVLYNAIDPKLYSVTKSKDDIRKQLSIESDKFLILSAGRITSWKGYEVLIRAVANCGNKNICVCIAGDSSIGSEDYFNYVKKLVRDLDLGQQIKFVGFIENIANFLNSSDLVVHCPVKDEPLGRLILEAMFLGKTVIASRNGGTPEIIEDHINGIMFEPGNSEELADKINQAFIDRDLLMRIGKNAKETIENKFSPKDHSSKLLSIYEEVLKNEKQGN